MTTSETPPDAVHSCEGFAISKRVDLLVNLVLAIVDLSSVANLKWFKTEVTKDGLDCPRISYTRLAETVEKKARHSNNSCILRLADVGNRSKVR